ncbi:MAG TPA: hypothetical protein ENH86_02565 [Candidatus Jorgensenbacteria bacterium]|uniref:Uncharacterized protein n=1 Tax=marine sediment metagenome TaxID=412755 RepID=A0A0F9M3H7_9ZZZZ|nr:hypothetical protein [Candidatus Jorgensenbacteria bacterium]
MIKAIFFFIVGVAAVIVLLLGVGLVVVVLVWFWNYGRYEGGKLLRKVLVSARATEEEIESDVQYSVRRVKKTLEKTKKNLSLKEMVNAYWKSVEKIVERFLTKNK